MTVNLQLTHKMASFTSVVEDSQFTPLYIEWLSAWILYISVLKCHFSICVIKIHKLFVLWRFTSCLYIYFEVFTKSEHKLWYCMYNQHLRTCKVPCWCIQLLLAEMALQLRGLMPCLCRRFQRRFQRVCVYDHKLAMNSLAMSMIEWGRVTASLYIMALYHSTILYLTLYIMALLHSTILYLTIMVGGSSCISPQITSLWCNHQHLPSLSTIVLWPTAVTVVTTVTNVSCHHCVNITQFQVCTLVYISKQYYTDIVGSCWKSGF